LVNSVAAMYGPRMRYPLSLALDFLLLAQQVSRIDATAKSYRPNFDKAELFERYPLRTEHGGRTANTLTISVGSEFFGIRALEELIVDLFHRLGRTKFPSAYVYNTG